MRRFQLLQMAFPEPQTLAVDTTYGPWEVEALAIRGSLALHAEIGSADRFVVTHVATGIALRSGLTETQAWELFRLLDRLRLDWSFTDKKRYPRLTRRGVRWAVVQVLSGRGVPGVGGSN